MLCTHRYLLLLLLLVTPPLVLAGCGGSPDDEFNPTENPGDDDDDDVADDDTGDPPPDDDSAGGDDDTFEDPLLIEGTVSAGAVQPSSDPPYAIAVELFAEAECGENGPDGQPTFMELLEADSLPADYQVLHGEGAVCLRAILDEDGSGLDAGPSAGDLTGVHVDLVTAPASGVDIVLDEIFD